MKNTKTLLVIAFTVLGLVSLACSLGGPKPDATAYPTLEPTALANSLATSVAVTPDTRTAVITLNEQQVSSYLALQLAEQPDAPISNPQVLLRNGQMEIYGVATTAKVTANVQVIAKFTVNPQGEPMIDLVSANFGPIPVPSNLKDYLATQLNDAILNGFGTSTVKLKVLSIEIQDGLVLITVQQGS